MFGSEIHSSSCGTPKNLATSFREFLACRVANSLPGQVIGLPSLRAGGQNKAEDREKAMGRISGEEEDLKEALVAASCSSTMNSVLAFLIEVQFSMEQQ
jgi:hypothetical protein